MNNTVLIGIMRATSPFTTVQFLSCTSFMPHVSCNLWMTLVQDWRRGGFPIDRWCVLTHTFLPHPCVNICSYFMITYLPENIPFLSLPPSFRRYFAWGGNTQGDSQTDGKRQVVLPPHARYCKRRGVACRYDILGSIGGEIGFLSSVTDETTSFPEEMKCRPA